MRIRAAVGESVADSQPKLPREVWALVATGFIVAIGFGIVAPALPAFARSFDVSITAVSVLVSAFAAMRLIFAPLSGGLVSRLGEQRMVVIGCVIVGITTGACGFAAAYWQLLTLRAAGGFGSTMFTIGALALLVRVAPPELRGRATGMWATSFLLGNVTGPLVGGALLEVSLRAPFFVYGGSLFVAAALTWLSTRRSALLGDSSGSDGEVLRFREAARDRSYLAALTSNFTVGWAVFGVRIALVPLFVIEVLHRDAAMAGAALSVFAVGNVIVLLGSGRVTDAIGRKIPVLIGLSVAGAATVGMGLSNSIVVFFAASALAGMGTGMLMPAQSAAIADVIGSDRRGGPVLAGYQMAADVGAVSGPVLAGLVADYAGYGGAFILTGALPFVAALLWLFAPETKPRRRQPGPAPEAATPSDSPAP